MEIYGRRDELGLLADQYLDQDFFFFLNKKNINKNRGKKWTEVG